MIELDSPPTPAPVTPPPAPERRWRFAAGAEIVPGRVALELLGGGDRYEAWLAWDERLHATVVTKLLRPHLVDDPKARAAIENEAAALETLAHPVIVRSFGSHLGGERPHLVLEHLDGPRLSTLLRRFGPLAAEQLVPLGRALNSALAYMHGQAWLHLDVKPRNIVMTASPRLIDLSVARTFEAATRISGYVGTDAYMSPEQADRARFAQIGPASDVWGLGATLYEALTGRQGFPGTPERRFPQLDGGQPSVPSKAPPALAALLGACLADDPAARPSHAEIDATLESLDEWSGRSLRRLR
jgi:eukaryotic-like serine/threonine-protein kinase